MRFPVEESKCKLTLAMILTGIECRLMAGGMPESFNDGVVARRVSAARDIITVSSFATVHCTVSVHPVVACCNLGAGIGRLSIFWHLLALTCVIP